MLAVKEPKPKPKIPAVGVWMFGLMRFGELVLVPCSVALAAVWCAGTVLCSLGSSVVCVYGVRMRRDGWTGACVDELGPNSLAWSNVSKISEEHFQLTCHQARRTPVAWALQ